MLPDGEALIDSTTILDHVDEAVGPARAMLPADGPARRQALRVCAFATGLADKAVSLLYERVLHPQVSETWVERCRTQIGGTLDVLEAERAAGGSAFWFSEAIGHADIAIACALRFLREAHPDLFDPAVRPALDRHAARCEALPAFRAVVQALSPPRAA